MFFWKWASRWKWLSGRTTPQKQSHYIRKNCSEVVSLLKEQYNRSGVRKQTNLLGEWFSVCQSASVGSYTSHRIQILHLRRVLTVQRKPKQSKALHYNHPKMGCISTQIEWECHTAGISTNSLIMPPHLCLFHSAHPHCHCLLRDDMQEKRRQGKSREEGLMSRLKTVAAFTLRV